MRNAKCEVANVINVVGLIANGERRKCDLKSWMKAVVERRGDEEEGEALDWGWRELYADAGKDFLSLFIFTVVCSVVSPSLCIGHRPSAIGHQPAKTGGRAIPHSAVD